MSYKMLLILTGSFFIMLDSKAVAAEQCPDGCRCLIGSYYCEWGCKLGYFEKKQQLETGIINCHKCPKTCQTCSSMTLCSKCIDGRWGDICDQLCPNNCKTCTSSSNCNKCSDGYYGIICDAVCPSNCKDCTSPIICTKCLDGFWGDRCDKTCPIGCRVCGPYSGQCTSCKTGFFSTVSDTNEIQCKPCSIAKCIQCEHDTTCKECEIGWYGVFCNHTCSAGCLEERCSIHGDCVCKVGYYKSFHYSYMCNECPKSCARCHSVTNCTECKPGYWGQNCSKECSNGCHRRSCDHINGQCSKCKSGFLHLTNGTCLDCREACANCTSGTVCEECHDGGVCDELEPRDDWIERVVRLTVGVVGTVYFMGMMVVGVCLVRKWRRENTGVVRQGQKADDYPEGQIMELDTYNEPGQPECHEQPLYLTLES